MDDVIFNPIPLLSPPFCPPRFPLSSRTIFRLVQLCVCVFVLMPLWGSFILIFYCSFLQMLPLVPPPPTAPSSVTRSHICSSASEMLITWVTVASEIMPLFPWQPPVKSNSLPKALHHFSMTLTSLQISFNLRAAVFMGCQLMDEPKQERC